MDGRPSRDAGDNFAVRDLAKEAAAQSLAKDRDLLLDFLATADQAQQQHQRQPHEDMLSALSSIVSILESMRKQDTAEQPLSKGVEALSSLVKPQRPADQQQQEPAVTTGPVSAAVHQQQAAWLSRTAAEEQWKASCDGATALKSELTEKDQAFSASLLRFLQGQQGRDATAESVAPAGDAHAATRTPEAIQEPLTSSEKQADAPPRQGAKPGAATSRSTSTSSCASSSNNIAVDVSLNAAAGAKASRRRSSDASCPSSETRAASPPADSASVPDRRAEERNEGMILDQQQQQRGQAADLSASSADATVLSAPGGTAGGNSPAVAFDTRLVGCGSWW